MKNTWAEKEKLISFKKVAAKKRQTKEFTVTYEYPVAKKSKRDENVDVIWKEPIIEASRPEPRRGKGTVQRTVEWSGYVVRG